MQVRLDKEVSKMLVDEVELQNEVNQKSKLRGAASASGIANYIVWKYFKDAEEKRKKK